MRNTEQRKLAKAGISWIGYKYGYEEQNPISYKGCRALGKGYWPSLTFINFSNYCLRKYNSTLS